MKITDIVREALAPLPDTIPSIRRRLEDARVILKNPYTKEKDRAETLETQKELQKKLEELEKKNPDKKAPDLKSSKLSLHQYLKKYGKCPKGFHQENGRCVKG